MDILLGWRHRTRAAMCSAASEYAGLWGWTVVPGAHLVRGNRCSCGNDKCASPGAHPLLAADEVPPGSSAELARALWDSCPGAAVLLPVGRDFDVVEVSERAGRCALARLERMGTRVGPVLATPQGRALFFVAPGAAAELPDLLYKMGWDDAGLDLRCLPLGGCVAAPPSELAPFGTMRWLRPPAPDTAAHPPQVRLLLGTLAYACHRSREPATDSWLPTGGVGTGARGGSR